MKIKEIKTKEELKECVKVIKKAFKEVAIEFNLTSENCPTHSSFINLTKLNALKKMDVKLFGAFNDIKQIGFIAIEKIGPHHFYIEDVSILPKFRKCGNGTQLINFAFNYIKNNKGKIARIGIIDEKPNLKNWYLKFGFEIVKTKKYNHLPFTACYLEKIIT